MKKASVFWIASTNLKEDLQVCNGKMNVNSNWKKLQKKVKEQFMAQMTCNYFFQPTCTERLLVSSLGTALELLISFFYLYNSFSVLCFTWHPWDVRRADKWHLPSPPSSLSPQFSTMTMQAFAPAGRIFVSVLTLCRTKNWNKIFYAL